MTTSDRRFHATDGGAGFSRPDIRRLPGSFRDPCGFVFVQNDVLYRQINERYAPDYEHFVASGLGADLIQRGLLIPHVEVPAAAAPWFEGYRLLEPERVPFVSYPYEWSFSQLQDAALLTLEIQSRALRYGMSLKDASAFNVQFVGGRPIFIDTISFERYVEGRPWVAYRQFCQHFLAPLALMAYRDVGLNQLFRIFLDGIPLDLASSLLPLRTRLRPGLGMHIHLHAHVQRRYAAGGPQAATGRTRELSRRGLTGVLDSLSGAVRSLRWKPEGTEWIGYYDETNYSAAAAADKERLVSGMIARRAPATVWDLGANTGRFSRLAASRGAFTVAFDVDPAVVERLYLDGKAAGESRLLPLRLDLANPSDRLGWASAERMSLADRGPADLILALALVHHLAIGNNVPLPDVASFFATIGRSLVVEFVPKTDFQVLRLLASRADIFDDYTREGFEAAFRPHFDVRAPEAVGDSGRLLYEMIRR